MHKSCLEAEKQLIEYCTTLQMVTRGRAISEFHMIFTYLLKW